MKRNLHWRGVLALAIGILGSATACPCPERRADYCQNQEVYSKLALARERAMYKLIGIHGDCFPPDYDVKAFFTDLQGSGIEQSDLENLRSTALDVWTEPDCTGYVLVARCDFSGGILLWDKSSTPSTLDGPGGTGRLPPRTADLPPHIPPTSCACKAGAQPQ
jgi:hypothetical protein